MTDTQPPYEPHTVVLVGASVRAAAESVRRAGIRVIGIDLFGDTDTRRACQQFFKISDSESSVGREGDTILDACAGLPLLTVGGFSGSQPLVERLSSVCPELGPSQSLRSKICDPAVLKRLAQTSGTRFPKICWPRLSAQPVDCANRRSWLVKQRNSCGGLGVRWWANGRLAPDSAIVQQWVPGRNFGATFLSNGSDVQLLGICRSLFTRTGFRPFVYAGSIGPVQISDSIVSRLRKLGQSMVDSFPFSGLFNADVIVDREGEVWLLEINLRWTSSMELIDRSLNSSEALGDGRSLLGCALNQQLMPSLADGLSQTNRRYLKRIIYARHQQHFCLADLEDHLGPNQSIHDIPLEGQVIRRGEPILTVITAVDPHQEDSLKRYRDLRRRIE
jgi:predicted ATP-grasp superfamily ATP-dependent carboligase